MSTAWRTVQRRAVRFAIRCGQAAEGLKLARALAMSTYRSADEFKQRFGAQPRCATPDEQRSGAGQFVFPVEEYLVARGEEYAARYQPDGFLCLSESIDLHRVDATRIATPVVAVGVLEDQLVPIGDMRRLVALLPRARLVEFSSLYGHDAFLKASQPLAGVFAQLDSD
jgi:homoserine O-acetyltransferase/O-succinyltransferase